MSDPVTHAEIEDVLSSIRRLVSEDGRPQEAAPKPAGRLVLTPALRVHEKPDQPEGAAAGAAQERTGPSGPGPALDHLAGMECLKLNGADAVPEAGAGIWAEPEASAGADAAAGPCAKDEIQRVPEERDAHAEAPDAEAPWADPRATLFSAATAAPRINGNANTAGGRAASVLQKIAELEAKVAQSPGEWEPDGASQDPFSGTATGTIVWQDDLETAQTGAAAAGEGGNAPDRDMDADLAETALTDTALASLPPEAAYHDEDSLRELVASIVREELQGALGERITRNIRKLVRREIHRVLSTQDLL
ncbi:hypothetical protein [Cribrihabitans pelagius]|uniref:hypothetical protein n=1 Tax=Cribrihabitans pelagius TaxID=1765746 RepID=UPI003B5AFF7B